MEVEALESILMEDMRVVEGSEGIAGATHAPCYQIAVSALGDGEEEEQHRDGAGRGHARAQCSVCARQKVKGYYIYLIYPYQVDKIFVHKGEKDGTGF